MSTQLPIVFQKIITFNFVYASFRLRGTATVDLTVWTADSEVVQFLLHQALHNSMLLTPAVFDFTSLVCPNWIQTS
jgi:hypothetical protein